MWLYDRRVNKEADTKWGNMLKMGIMLPFNGENNKESNMIVRIAHEEFNCFNTRERAPYMFVVETIDPKELELKVPNLKKDPDYEKVLYAKEGNKKCGNLKTANSLISNAKKQLKQTVGKVTTSAKSLGSKVVKSETKNNRYSEKDIIISAANKLPTIDSFNE